MTKPHPAQAAAGVAGRFLATLDGDQRTQAHVDFPSEDIRRDWHYVPRERSGLCLADMSASQQKLALQLLATGFSIGAYAQACAVMALEDPLDALEGGVGPRRFQGRRGWGRHRLEYHVVVFGSPQSSEWGWRFEGHHVSVTMTVVGERSVTVPHFLGANPAEIGPLRVLPHEEDLAFAVLNAMTPSERADAMVASTAPDDILTTNAPVLDVLPPDEGVLLRNLSAPAQRAADPLVRTYLGREPARRRVDVAALRFAFAGEPAHRRPHYYRLQSDQLLVEYDNTQNDANHVHTVVRSPGLDFGDDLLRRHHAEDH